MTSPSRQLLFLTVFAGGMATLAIELSASRLLGHLFGTSNIVWANIIGLMLIYLSAGYFLGGCWADRDPRLSRLFLIAAWGAFLSGLAPFAARFLLPVIATLGLPVGLATILPIFVLFAIPVTLLGCISPFAIRVGLETIQQAGQVTGRIYALSTLGSVIGALVPVLYLLPEAGTLTTMLFFAEALLVVSLTGLAFTDRRRLMWLVWMPPCHIILWLTVR